MLHLTSLSQKTSSKSMDKKIFAINRLTLLLWQWTAPQAMSSVAYFTRSVGAHHIIMQMHLLGSQRDAWHLLNQFYMERLLHSIGWEKDKLLNYWCVASCYKSRPSTLHIKGPCLEDIETWVDSLVSKEGRHQRKDLITSHYKSIYEKKMI